MINEYTTNALVKIIPGMRLSVEIAPEIENTYSTWNLWPSMHIDFPRPFDVGIERAYRNGFIGILTEEEANNLKTDIDLFRKRFDDDLARRNKILFGE